MSAPHTTRTTLGIAALASLVLVFSAALFVQSSCTPSGATQTPTAGPPPKTPDDTPRDADLTPDPELHPPAVT